MSGSGESLVTMVLGSFVTKCAYVETSKSVVKHSEVSNTDCVVALCVTYTDFI